MIRALIEECTSVAELGIARAVATTSWMDSIRTSDANLAPRLYAIARLRARAEAGQEDQVQQFLA